MFDEEDPYHRTPTERFADCLCWVLVAALLGIFVWHYFAFPRPIWWSLS